MVFLTATSGPWARPPAGSSQVMDMVLGGGIRGLDSQLPEMHKRLTKEGYFDAVPTAESELQGVADICLRDTCMLG